MSAQAISDILARSAAVKLATAEQCSVPAFEASKAIATSLQGGGKLLLCGNGGSAGDAQHLAAEFVATLDHKRPRAGLAAIALTTDTSFITA